VLVKKIRSDRIFRTLGEIKNDLIIYWNLFCIFNFNFFRVDAKQMKNGTFEKIVDKELKKWQLMKKYIEAKTNEERKKIGHQLDKLKKANNE